MRNKIQSSSQFGKLLRARVIHYLHIFGNSWIDYFQVVQNEKILLIGDNWVDFENEITGIIQKFEKYILNLNNLKQEKQERPDRDMSYFVSNYNNCTVKILTQKDIPNMAWDLKMLTLALEFYLIETINNTKDIAKIKPIPIIERLNNISAIISYNYSNIFGKIYQTDATPEIYFIHGELGKHNLVLGIGETLSKEKENNFTVCASFKKFFQRVKYKLGNRYENIAQGYYADYEWQIVIYGHSLDKTDGDSLRWLLVNSHKFHTPVKQILIYYYNDNAYNKQIANIIQIIGKEQLIKDVDSKRIIFLPINNSY